MDQDATSLPPEFGMLSMLIDGQAAPVREAFPAFSPEDEAGRMQVLREILEDEDLE